MIYYSVGQGHDMSEPEALIKLLELQPHPEGGFFRETWRDDADGGSRGAGTAIYFMLTEGQVSRWHRIDATEIWHHYAGSPVLLTLQEAAGRRETHELSGDLWGGHRPQCIVPPGAWQMARTAGAWSLVGCTVSPAFEFDKFELAPEGWEPSAS